MDSCKVNQIFLGEISSVQNYGAFVKIPGYSQQGLVHRSQVSSTLVEDTNDVLQKGDRVWCKIISIGDDGKIALSMKHVNQGNGKDLDPNGVQLHQDEQKRKKLNTKEGRKVIVLDAIYKTICSKCKTPGHLAKDCFTTPDGKKYELLPEIEDEEVTSKPTIEIENKKGEKKNKLKKAKKRKRSKSTKQENSDDDGSSIEKRKKKKKTKDLKHKKKKHRSTSDSDSSSTSISSPENRKHSKKCKHSKVKH